MAKAATQVVKTPAQKRATAMARNKMQKEMLGLLAKVESQQKSVWKHVPSPEGFSPTAWDALINRTIETIHDLAQTKGEEYSGTVDRLANFRRGASELGLTKEQVLMVYAGKHWDAIRTYVKEQANPAGTPRVLSEPISGRVDDLIVYLLLFKAMLEEGSSSQ